MKGFDAYIASANTPLEQRPEVLDSVGVDMSANISFHVVDDLVVIAGFQMRIKTAASSVMICEPAFTLAVTMGSTRVWRKSQSDNDGWVMVRASAGPFPNTDWLIGSFFDP